MTGSKPIGLRWRSHTLFIVSTVAIALFTDLFLYGLVVPVLPFILEKRANISQSEIQTFVSILLAVYAAASVIFSPCAGIIADRVPSRQTPFLVGLFALLGATLIFMLGRNIAVLIVARILQGISAAVVWTVGLALTLDTVGPENLGKTIGSMFGFISMGELAAPVLGGVLYKKAGDAGVFGLGFGLLTIDFFLRLLLIEKKTAARFGVGDKSDGRDDSHHMEHDNENDQDPNEEDPLISKNEEDYYKVSPNQKKRFKGFPIVYCLKDSRLLTALLVALVQAALLSTFDATIPTVARDFYGLNSLKGGLLFIPLVLPYLLLGPVAGYLVDRYGPKFAAVGGYSYLFPILICLRLVRPGGTAQIGIFCTLLALCGLGLAFISAPSIVEAAFVVQRYQKVNPEFFGDNGPYAQLYGLNSMVFSAGLTLGPLLSGLLREKIGYGNTNLVVAMICLVTAILSFVNVGGKPQILKRNRHHRLLSGHR